jgi:dienelactone hydrolase
VHSSDVRYEADGRSMIGYLTFDDGLPGPLPAVLVSHEGNGLSEHSRGVADRLASLGYAAFALDYCGNGEVLPMEEAMELLGALMTNPERTAALALAGLDLLLSKAPADPSRVAAIGFCFGGAMSLELARTGADVKAVVGFHPSYPGPRPDASRNIKGSVLMCSGADDPFATAEQRLAFETDMREAEVADWQLEVYGAVGHSFTNPAVDRLNMPGMAYNAVADRRSWQSMLELFDEKLAHS